MEAIKAAAAITTATGGRTRVEPLLLPTRRCGGRMYVVMSRPPATLGYSIEAGAD